MSTLLDRAKALKADAQTIAENAKREGRELTATEATDFDGLIEAAEKAYKSHERVIEGEDILRQMGADEIVAPGAGRNGDRKSAAPDFVTAVKSHIDHQSKMLAAREPLMKWDPANGTEIQRKAFTVSGSLTVPSTTVIRGTIHSPMTSPFLIDLLGAPEQIATPEWSYLRQTTRTNNAAPVALGALKPTSVYALERVTAPTTTIAHLSDPIPIQHLEDETSLETFIGFEMLYGLKLAIDDQVLNGDGIDPNLAGVLNTAGIQVQAYDTSVLITTRKALTKLQLAGIVDQSDGNVPAQVAYVMHPSDWEAIELLTNVDGEYLMREGPVDPAKRQLWGIPVLVTESVAVGAALLGHWSQAKMVARGGVSVKWTDAVSDDFSRNQVRFRVEGRFGLGVITPSAFVNIDLTAGP